MWQENIHRQNIWWGSVREGSEKGIKKCKQFWTLILILTSSLLRIFCKEGLSVIE